MLFKPQWYQNLPADVKPLKNETIRNIENWRKANVPPTPATVNTIWMAIMNTKWAVRRIQYSAVKLARRMNPSLSEQDSWEEVLRARLQTKLRVASTVQETDIHAKPMAPERLRELLETIPRTILRFKSFDEVVDFIISLDEEENRFSPNYIVDEIEKILSQD